MIYSATGHRPDKLGGYSLTLSKNLIEFAVERLRKLKDCEKMISGMALGWDQAVAQACVIINMPFIAAVPFKGQEFNWPYQSRVEYQYLLKQAETVSIISEGGYAVWKMQTRNQWMVDNSGRLLALWNGTSGGTANCVKYAQKKGVKILNVWDKWIKFQERSE